MTPDDSHSQQHFIETLDWLCQLQREQKTSRACFFAEEWIKNLIKNQEYKVCGDLLDTIDPHRTGETLALSILSVFQMAGNAWNNTPQLNTFRKKIILYLFDRKPLPEIAQATGLTNKELIDTLSKVI